MSFFAAAFRALRVVGVEFGLGLTDRLCHALQFGFRPHGLAGT